MLNKKYKAFEIRDDDVSQTLVEGNLPAIAGFISRCHKGSIITIHTLDGEPFLLGLSKMFLYCEDKVFLDQELIPYLRGKTIVLDSLFEKEELLRYIREKEQAEVEVRPGVYDRLTEGGAVTEKEPVSGEERRLRIYQLGQESPLMMRFISLAERKKRGYGKPQRGEYTLVYEGEIRKFDLEAVWEKFGLKAPQDFSGHALSISDVVEFAEGNSSRFFYVEPSGYEEVIF